MSRLLIYGAYSTFRACNYSWRCTLPISSRPINFIAGHPPPLLLPLQNRNFGGVSNRKNGSTVPAKPKFAVIQPIFKLGFGAVKWVVVLPFRVGRATVGAFTVCLKTVSRLTRLAARAAVVAKVSGVSGIFYSIVEGIRHTIHWCKTGFKLYAANIKVSYYILLKRLKGHPMRYNERKLLMKTLNDALKMVPFSFFIIVPFAEFLLPIAIRLFPQMLPSTFQKNKNKDDDYLQKKLLAKQELAQFFQELVQERTNQILQEELDSSLRTKAEALQQFQQRLLNKNDIDVNPFLTANELLVFSKLFKKEFVLEKMNLETLKVMCKLLGITPFALRSHVVLQLRHHLLKTQREDRLIMWEGVDSLTTEELREACRDRAMKFYNISKEQMQQQLRHWLDLSSRPEINPILLLWSRCITMTHEPMKIKEEEVEAEAEAGATGDSARQLEEGLKAPPEPAEDVFQASATAGDDDTSDVEQHKQTVYDLKSDGERFAQEVSLAQLACKSKANSVAQYVAEVAEVDAEHLLEREQELQILSDKAKELRDMIKADAQENSATLDDADDQGSGGIAKDTFESSGAAPHSATSVEDGHGGVVTADAKTSAAEKLEEEFAAHEHVHETQKMHSMSKSEMLARHQQLLKALDLQEEICDLQHHQLVEMYQFLLTCPDIPNLPIARLLQDVKDSMEKIETLTKRFDELKLDSTGDGSVGNTRVSQTCNTV